MCACKHEKRESERKNSGMTKLVVFLVRDSKATHLDACQKNNLYDPFSLSA